MTDDQAKQTMTTLLAAYPVETRNISGREIAAIVEAYRNGLADLDDELVQRAVDVVTKTSERLPTIAKIRQAAVELQHGHRRPGGDAWGDVVAAIRRHGASKTPGVDFVFPDPLVARAVDRMAWRELCLSTNQVADRARFIELYDEYAHGIRTVAQVAAGATHPALPAARDSGRDVLVVAPRSGDSDRHIAAAIAARLSAGVRIR